MRNNLVVINNIDIEFISGGGDENKVRIIFEFLFGEKETKLYYEVSDKYRKYLSDDRADAALIAVLLYAVRFGYNIKINVPISETLYYHVITQIVPQLCAADQKCHHINIECCELLDGYQYCEKAVATGISLGVDSMATLQEYEQADIPKSYKITHLTYHEVGAHHGMDAGKSGPFTSEQLFKGQLEKAKDFCDKYHYELVVVNSNLQSFLRTMFPRLSFHTNCTYRNVSAVLILQKLFSKFYCASAFNLDEFECDSAKDSEKYEKFLLPYLSTDNTKFYNSNRDWKRIEKVERLSKYEPSYDYLTVCLTHINNCGKCMKCKRTLLNLDVVGSLDKYRKSFDIEHYVEYDRSTYLKDLWSGTSTGGRDPFLKEILDYALSHDFQDLPYPDIEYYSMIGNGKINKVNLRKYPSTKSRILEENLVDNVIIKGKYKNWYYVITTKGQEGFCYMDYVQLITQPYNHKQNSETMEKEKL